MMPPLAFTQVKYALAMFAMSANDVPGWLVTIPPSGIGVPVAFTPGLLPHCDVLTDVPLGAGAEAEESIEGGVPRSASIEAEDKLVQVVLKVHPAQAVIDAQTPALEVGEQVMGSKARQCAAIGPTVIALCLIPGMSR